MNAQRLAMKAETFKLLAECYYAPEGDLHTITDDLSRCLISVCPGAARPMKRMREAIAREPDPTPRKVDYARLFVGPFGVLAPPYGSVYLEGERRVMGGSTMNVRDTYLDEGLDLSENCREAPDHIAVELEFMHFLACKEAEAAAREDREGALQYAQKQNAFLEGHLEVWVPEFTDLIKSRAQTEFYKGLAECTSIFLTGLLGKGEGHAIF